MPNPVENLCIAVETGKLKDSAPAELVKAARDHYAELGEFVFTAAMGNSEYDSIQKQAKDLLDDIEGDNHSTASKQRDALLDALNDIHYVLNKAFTRTGEVDAANAKALRAFELCGINIEHLKK